MIGWKAVNGADGYCVYRKDSIKGSYVLCKTISSGAVLTYTNTSLKQGNTYYYRVKAYKNVNGKKIYSCYSKTVSISV